MKKIILLSLFLILNPLSVKGTCTNTCSNGFDGFCLSIFDGMSLTKIEQTQTEATNAVRYYQYTPGMYSIGIDAFCSKALKDWLIGVGGFWNYNFNHYANVTTASGEQTIHKKNDIGAYIKIGYAIPRILFFVKSGYIGTPFSYPKETETSQGMLAGCGLDIKLMDNLVLGLDVGCAFYRKLSHISDDGSSNTYSTQALNTQFKIGWLF